MATDLQDQHDAGDSRFTLEHDASGALVLIDSAGNRHAGVVPVRAFPFTDPTHWISLCNQEGSELAVVHAIEALPAAQRVILQDALWRNEFIPRILRVRHVSHSEPYQWQVDTDRGSTTFILKSEDDIRRMGDHQALLVDAEGIRYWIADLLALDTHSQRLLERFV